MANLFATYCTMKAIKGKVNVISAPTIIPGEWTRFESSSGILVPYVARKRPIVNGFFLISTMLGERPIRGFPGRKMNDEAGRRAVGEAGPLA